MRRIAPAIGSVLALVALTVPATPAHSAVSHTSADPAPDRAVTTSRSGSGIGLDSGAPGATFVHVSWNWIRAVSGYRVQVSKKQDFSAVVATKKKRNSSRRPAGGREATVVGQLKDATYYWVRVRKVKGTHKSSWSSPVRVATKAHWPDPMSRVRGIAGPTPGTTTLKWRSDGGYTDFYRVTTALSPFGSKKTPAVGRDSMNFKVPGDRTHVTLTPEQTAAAGAALGTGRHLFFRISAVRQGEADSQSRPYGRLLSTTIAGQASPGAAHPIRFGQYNMHIFSRDVAGHRWKDRASLIAKNIANVHPAIMSLQELLPPMWTKDAGGPGLHAALRRAGAGEYRLTRETPFAKGTPGDSRILYDPTQVELTSTCDPTAITCLIQIPDPARPHYAAYAQFKDLATGRQFWFVSTHLTPGNNATTDALRGRQADAIAAAMDAENKQHLPVIVGGDFNSSQTSRGSDSPHTEMIKAGYYSTMAAARQVNLQYNSVNAYTDRERPSPYGFGSIIDTLMTLNMPGADLFKEVRTGRPWPSDHNMIFTDVRLP
jgi:endonuclease/exonuclease/phosphatase family metal-dependent hydrolase